MCNGLLLSETPNLPASSMASLPAWLWLILGGLRQAIAALGGRDRAAVPLVVLAWGRVGRLAQRFETLMARLVAGTLPAPRPRAGGRGRRPAPGAEARGLRPAPGAEPPQAEAVRLPRGFGWLVRMVPGAASYGSQLEAMLADPAMAALLESCPRALRIIRPLKHMLGIAEPGAPVRTSRPRTAWWQAVPAVDAMPSGPVPFPTGRPPPSWFR